MAFATRPVEDRLFPRLIESPQGCWLWPGASVRGYGQIYANRKTVLTHRAAWEYVVGVIPAELVLDHLCLTAACCNPAHLEVVTQRENNRRAGLAGWAAENANKTHCIRGHALTGRNLRVERSGSRRCRACWYETRRRYRQRKKAA